MLRTFLLALAALVLVAPFGAAVAAEDDPIDVFHEKMKEADETARVALIGDLIKSGHEEAPKALAKYIGDRSTAVRVAAIRGLGELKASGFYGTLVAMVKRVDKEPEVLTAVLDAIGMMGEKKSEKLLMDTAKKWLFKDAEVAMAAARGLGKIPLKKAVEDLIVLLAMTYPASGGSGAQVSAETVAMLKKARPAVIGGLQELTGWDFEDADAWNNFWELEQRTWKPGDNERDLTKIMEWVDPGYGFKISRPTDKWFFSRTGDYKAYRIYFDRKTEDVLEGYVFVQAYVNTGLTAEQKAQEWEDSYRSKWRDIKEESMQRGDWKLGREKGFFHGFTGRDGSGNIAKLQNHFIIHKGFMFIVGAWQRSGITGVDVELQKALDSFELLFK